MTTEPRVITAPAELNVASAPQLGTAITAALERGDKALVVDFGAVERIDSAGIGILLSAQRRVDAVGGELVVANPSRHVRRVFALTGVGRALRLA